MPIQSIKKILLNNLIFFSVLYLCILYLLFRNILSSNEQVCLVFAKHFINKNWIISDWFLNKKFGYQNIFNFIAGWWAFFIPLPYVAIVGRLVVYLLFAFLIQAYARQFSLPAYFVIPFIAFYLRFPDITAGEWMLGDFETKPFAYFFILLSLYYFVERNYWRTCLYLGLSMSFHVLVGLYGSFCMAGALIANYRDYHRDLKTILKNFYIFFISSSFGLFVVFQHLFQNFKVDNILAGEIYVLKRGPHHTYPAYWQWPEWLIKTIILCIPLIIMFFWFKDRKYRVISSFALSSLVLFIIGILIFYFDAVHLLKFYWFRFPDVIVPFFGFFALALIGNRVLEEIGLRSRKLYKSGVVLALSASLLILGTFGVYGVKKIRNHFQFGRYFYLSDLNNYLLDVFFWIRKNTPKEGIFLIDPSLDRFYVGAERALFVSFKHIPRTDKDIIQWYFRIKLCNNDKELRYLGFNNINDIQENYYDLSENIVNYIASHYHIDYFLTKKIKKYSFPIIYENEMQYC